MEDEDYDLDTTYRLWRESHGIDLRFHDTCYETSNEWKQEKSTGKWRPVCSKQWCAQFQYKYGLCAKHWRHSRPCSHPNCEDSQGEKGRCVQGFVFCQIHTKYYKQNPNALLDLS